MSASVYARLLHRCGKNRQLWETKKLHASIIQNQIGQDLFLANNLITNYGKCGSLHDAGLVFDRMTYRDVVSWNAIIGMYSKHGQCKEALLLFSQMQYLNLKADCITFISLVLVFTSPDVLDEGKIVHASIIQNGYNSDIILGTALLNMYGKCGNLDEATNIFAGMHDHDLVSWNALITTYGEHGHTLESIQLLYQLCLTGLEPSEVTFTSILNAKTSLQELPAGKLIHAFIVKCNFDSYTLVGTALLNMYGKCGSLLDAKMMFSRIYQHSLVTWNALITAYACLGQDNDAFQLSQELQHLEGMVPDEVTYIGVLSAPTSLTKGKLIHACIVKQRIDCDVELGTALINMYGKYNGLVEARLIFERIPKYLPSWNALIAAYACHGNDHQALEIYHQMQLQGVKPNNITCTSILNACADLAALEQVKAIHTDVWCKHKSDTILGNALLDTYSKCGSLKDAYNVFNNIKKKSVLSWNALIAANAQHGDGKEAIQLLNSMQLEGVNPTAITFINILFGCSHAGLKHEGCHFFVSLSEIHEIVHICEHYGCMIHHLGQIGMLDETEDFINEMFFETNLLLWSTFLGACKIYGDAKRGKRAMEHVNKLELGE